MMATTHALAGMALASVTLVLAPEQAPVAVLAATAGGVFPDLDLYAGHRKTLHYPVYYPLAAAVATLGATLAPTVATLALAWFLLGAALHSVMDVFGGGLELRPWEGTSQRAVYDHFNDRWLAPRRWVRYDGSPEDLLLAGALAAPAIALNGGLLDRVGLALLAVSVVWVLVRKNVATLTESLVPLLPPLVATRLPARFTEGVGGE